MRREPFKLEHALCQAEAIDRRVCVRSLMSEGSEGAT